MTTPLDGYVEVAERIEKFYAKYPEGSLRCKQIDSLTVGGQDFLVYVAQAYREPTDPSPAEGAAWEPVPGKTNFTRDSELMNAETSAWGRAIAALGFEVKRGIASANEVRNRREVDGGSGETQPDGPAVATGFASDKQKGIFERLLKEADVSADARNLIIPWAEDTQSGARGGGISVAIDKLKDGNPEIVPRLISASEAWAAASTDMPADVEDLPLVDDVLVGDE